MSDPVGVIRKQGRGAGDQEIHAIAAGDGKLVAVGSTDCDTVGVDYPESDPSLTRADPIGQCPQIWISEDGTSWETRSVESIATRDGSTFAASLISEPFAPDLSFTAFGYSMRGIAWTGDEFVAVGEAVWSSNDGYNWTMDPLPSATELGECTPVCRANDVLVTEEGLIAVGKDPTLQASPAGGKTAFWVTTDAMTWREVQLDLVWWSELNAIESVGDRYVAVGQNNDGAVAVAIGDPFADGIVKSEVLPLYTGAYGRDVVESRGRLVGVGYGYPTNSLRTFEGGVAAASILMDDESGWEPYPSDDMSLFGSRLSAIANADMKSMALFNDGIVVVGRYYTDAAVWIGTWTD